MGTLMRVSHFLVTLSVEGDTHDYGKWAQLEGGDYTTEATVTKPGGMSPGVAVPGDPATEAITLTRQFDRMRDAQSDYQKLKAHSKAGTPVTIGQQPLDYAGLAFGEPLVDTGVITSVTRPTHDANSEDIAMFSIVIQPNE